MKIVYIAETSLTNKSAYSQHVVKMSDAFGQLNHDLILYLPQTKENLSYEHLKDKFLLVSKKKFIIRPLTNFKLTNIFLKLFFLFKVIRNIKIDKPELILTRSFLSSIVLSLFKIKHILEIHSEFQSLTKFLMINLNFINSKYIKKKILISKSLNSIFKFKDKEFIVLHDGVDIKNFESIKIRDDIKKVCYTGSFYKGRGIELIVRLAKNFPNLKFELYGQTDDQLKIDLKNLKIYDYVNYCEIPNILKDSDLLLMPYAKKVSVRSKSLNTADYCSPLKMFDYLASGRIIISSKLSGICEVLKHNENSIIVENYEYKLWEQEINKIIKKEYDTVKLKNNAIETAREYTWVKRASSIISIN